MYKELKKTRVLSNTPGRKRFSNNCKNNDRLQSEMSLEYNEIRHDASRWEDEGKASYIPYINYEKSSSQEAHPKCREGARKARYKNHLIIDDNKALLSARTCQNNKDGKHLRNTDINRTIKCCINAGASTEEGKTKLRQRIV